MGNKSSYKQVQQVEQIRNKEIKESELVNVYPKLNDDDYSYDAVRLKKIQELQNLIIYYTKIDFKNLKKF